MQLMGKNMRRVSAVVQGVGRRDLAIGQAKEKGLLVSNLYSLGRCPIARWIRYPTTQPNKPKNERKKYFKYST